MSSEYMGRLYRERDPRLRRLQGNLTSASISLSSPKTSEPSCDTEVAICYSYHNGSNALGNNIPLSRNMRQQHRQGGCILHTPFPSRLLHTQEVARLYCVAKNEAEEL